MSEQQPSPTAEKIAFRAGDLSAAPFRDWEDYQNRGACYLTVDMIVHDLPGSARQLYYPVNAPDYARVTVEDVIRGVENLPDPGLIWRLYIVDHVHHLQPWEQQQSPGSVIASDRQNPAHTDRRTRDGIVLFRPTANTLPHALLFEWFQALMAVSFDKAELFRLAHDWEQIGAEEIERLTAELIANKAQRPQPEWKRPPTREWRVEWSNLGVRLLSHEPDEFLLTQCLFTPLRCAILANAIRANLSLLVYEPGFEKAVEATRRADYYRVPCAEFALSSLRKGDRPPPVHDRYDFVQIMEKIATSEGWSGP
jgi:hypothetical protein